jgi:putative peptidoglycan lipid II flippase
LAALTGGSITFLVYSAVIGWVVIAPLVSMRTASLLPREAGRWFDSRNALSIAALSLPVFLSLSLDQANVLVGTYLASSFPEGAISHLNYAQRLMLLFSSVFSLVIANVLFPYLTDSIIADRAAQARQYIALAVIAVLLLSAPLLVLSTVTSEMLVSFVFQRGQFKAEDAATTGYVMQFFAPVIVLAGLREVLNRLFLAWQKTKVLLWFSVLAIATNVIASVYFSRVMGLEGVALGATCGASVYVLAQLLTLLTWHRDLLHRDLPLWIALIATGTLVSGMAVRWLSSLDLTANARLDFLFIATIMVVVFAVVVLLPVIAFPRLREISNTKGLT